MTAVAFLTELWGERPPGHIQVWEMGERSSAYLADPRAAVNFEGRPDVFAAIGTTRARLGARRRASADQIAAIAGFVLDIDDDKAPNRTAAMALAHRGHMVPNVIVESGHGIHAYYLFAGGPWVFASIDEREEAKTLFKQFVTIHQQWATERGFRLDSVGDLARLMRLPGSVNHKDPDDPRPVTWALTDAPRRPLEHYRALLADVQTAEPGAPSSRAPVTLTGDTSAFAAKLDALLDNSPEFAAVWTGQRAFPSLSEADLSLCSMAAGAMTDPELAQLIYVHRQQHGDEDDKAKGRRLGYLRSTIRRARSRSERETQIAALDGLGRAAA